MNEREMVAPLVEDLITGESRATARTIVTNLRRDAQLGNSIVGSLLSLIHRIPRQYAEPAVAVYCSAWLKKNKKEVA